MGNAGLMQFASQHDSLHCFSLHYTASVWANHTSGATINYLVVARKLTTKLSIKRADYLTMPPWDHGLRAVFTSGNSAIGINNINGSVRKPAAFSWSAASLIKAGMASCRDGNLLADPAALPLPVLAQ